MTTDQGLARAADALDDDLVAGGVQWIAAKSNSGGGGMHHALQHYPHQRDLFRCIPPVAGPQVTADIFLLGTEPAHLDLFLQVVGIVHLQKRAILPGKALLFEVFAHG